MNGYFRTLNGYDVHADGIFKMGVFIKFCTAVLNFTLSNNTSGNFRYKGGSYCYKTNLTWIYTETQICYVYIIINWWIYIQYTYNSEISISLINLQFYTYATVSFRNSSYILELQKIWRKTFCIWMKCQYIIIYFLN